MLDSLPFCYLHFLTAHCDGHATKCAVHLLLLLLCLFVFVLHLTCYFSYKGHWHLLSVTDPLKHIPIFSTHQQGITFLVLSTPQFQNRNSWVTKNEVFHLNDSPSRFRYLFKYISWVVRNQCSSCFTRCSLQIITNQKINMVDLFSISSNLIPFSFLRRVMKVLQQRKNLQILACFCCRLKKTSIAGSWVNSRIPFEPEFFSRFITTT